VVVIVVFPSSCCLHHILVYSKETRPSGVPGIISGIYGN
jgi:hypothetical protein